MTKRLYKSQSDRMITGVSGGIAEYFEIDPTLVRAAWIFLAIFTAGAALIGYIALVIITPEESDIDRRRDRDSAYDADHNDEDEGESHDQEQSEDRNADSQASATFIRGTTSRKGNATSNNTLAALILIAIGSIFLTINFGIFAWFDPFGWFDLGTLWPLILIGVGLLLIFRYASRDG